MKQKAIYILSVAIVVFTAIYIGVFIGRTADTNTIYIPAFPELTKKLPNEPTETESIIDLNTATVRQLNDVPGITYAIAEKIIAYRDEYGDYVDVEELLEVDGISEALYEQIKDYVTVDDSLRPNRWGK